MYRLVSATLRERGINTTWKNVSVANMPMFTLFDKYVSGFITVKNPYLYHEIHVDINSLRNSSKFVVSNVTLSQWLTSVGDNTLEGTTTAPIISRSYVYAGDAWYTGFDIQRVLTGVSDNPNLPASTFRNLKVSKPLVDLNLLQNRALVTVNGFLHLTTPLEDGVLVHDGAMSLDVCKRNRVGVVSFANVGDIEQIKILPTMIGKDNQDFDYADGVYVSLGRNLTNKSLILSLGGFLHTQDGTFSIINEEKGIVRINPRKIDLVKRLLITQLTLDTSGLGMSQSPKFPGALASEEVYRDQTIVSWLLMAQSFAVVIDAPNIYTERLPLDEIDTNGVYECATTPLAPFMDALGRLQEYIVKRNDTVYQVQIEQGVYRQMLYETGDTNGSIVNDKTAAGNYENTQGALFEISFATYTVVEDY